MDALPFGVLQNLGPTLDMTKSNFPLDIAHNHLPLPLSPVIMSEWMLPE